MITAIILTLLLMQSPATTERYPVVQGDTVTLVSEQDLQIEYRRLRSLRALTSGQYRRLAAVEVTLGSIPSRCTEGQVDAGLCLPPNECITWEQHIAEVRSWWAAPERRYVACGDPRVGAPRRN